jgi:hypothetical protein
MRKHLYEIADPILLGALTLSRHEIAQLLHARSFVTGDALIAMNLSRRSAPELMTLYWTTAGIYPGVAEVSRFDFRDRVEAAARAGFSGIGIWHTDLEETLKTRSLREMKAILDNNGIKYLELEFLTGWFLDGAQKAESDRVKRLLLNVSAVLGAHHVKVGDFDRSITPMPRLVEAFSALCKDA